MLQSFEWCWSSCAVPDSGQGFCKGLASVVPLPACWGGPARRPRVESWWVGTQAQSTGLFARGGAGGGVASQLAAGGRRPAHRRVARPGEGLLSPARQLHPRGLSITRPLPGCGLLTSCSPPSAPKPTSTRHCALSVLL